ncbi:DNA-directed RNA polymerase [Aeromonas phage vB_AspA_Bolek]|nr:DNA-directed RNA polymerase [Aeromonas phage vB_AspA_Bolek]
MQSTLYAKQIEIEEKFSHAAVLAGIKAVQDAYAQGRGADVGVGRRLVAKAFTAAVPEVQAMLDSGTRGVGGKYRKLLRQVDTELLAVLGLREIVSGIASPVPVTLQDIMRDLGRAIETEALIKAVHTAAPKYGAQLDSQIEANHTKQNHHIQRTYKAGAAKLNIEADGWTPEERTGCGRLLLEALYETGIFQWGKLSSGKGKPTYVLEPAPEIAKHLQQAVDAAQAIMRFPPMIVPPIDWDDYYSGGYVTDNMRSHAPLASLSKLLRKDREWVIEGLASSRADVLKTAMNKTQSVAYSVNKRVLGIFRQALANPRGILGLPAHGSTDKPEFPLPDGWDKTTATPEELAAFADWKADMRAWYTAETERKGKKAGLVSRAAMLQDYVDYDTYYPTFACSRGRIYFRGTLNPQGHDAIKGCFQFATGKPLGSRGLFWLWVCVANACGYDKHSPEVKAQWAKDNWPMIEDFINNPLLVDAPDNDTAFSLLAAGLALQDALDSGDPEGYVCHIPGPMDATCSGLQHLSALTRDEVGAYHTNLIFNGTDKKSDIYRHVAGIAQETYSSYCFTSYTKAQKAERKEAGITAVGIDPVLVAYWADKPVVRNMAKPVVMTFVYGATLLSAMDAVAEQMKKQAFGTMDGYSMSNLSLPMTKALRNGVKTAVPKANACMEYWQTATRRSNDVIRWVSPAGMPVVNWGEGHVIKRVFVRSMGVEVVLLKQRTGDYDKQVAVDGVCPNITHSLDSGHLCLVIAKTDIDILPIHDSFATHMCDLDTLHYALRHEFVEMYKFDWLNELDKSFIYSADVDPISRPSMGNLDLNEIYNARDMFG